MKRIRKLLPLIVVALFSAVTLGHESQFIGSFEPDAWRWLGLPFALGIDVAIFISVYFAQWKTTERVAWWSYVVFALASGALNTAQVLGTAIEQGRFGNGWLADLVTGSGVITVALFPAGAQTVMGFLAREADKLPALKGGIRDFVASFFDGVAAKAQEKPQKTRADAPESLEDVALARVEASETQQDVRKRDFAVWIASNNGNHDTITRDDAFAWAIEAGVDVDDKSQRDKVSRWCREFQIESEVTP